MLGNWATGKVRMVSVPTSTSTIEITMATMGRLIKNFDMGLPPRSFHSKWLGVHLHTRAHFLHTFGNHPLARLHTVRNNPLRANPVADFHGSNAHFVLVIHRRNLIPALQLGNSTLG